MLRAKGFVTFILGISATSNVQKTFDIFFSQYGQLHDFYIPCYLIIEYTGSSEPLRRRISKTTLPSPKSPHVFSYQVTLAICGECLLFVKNYNTSLWGCAALSNCRMWFRGIYAVIGLFQGTQSGLPTYLHPIHSNITKNPVLLISQSVDDTFY